MSLSIQSTLAPGVRRSLRGSISDLQASSLRLATGVRIHGASDDPAGAGQAERLAVTVRSTNRALQNASDAVAALRTAESALVEQTALLQRLRELALQAGSPLSASERSAIQRQASELNTQIDRLAEETTYNGAKLLDGSFVSKSFQLSDGLETPEGTPFSFTLAPTSTSSLALVRSGNSTALINNFESPAGSTVTFDLNGTTINYVATGPSDQAGNAANLLAALNAAAGTLSPLGLGFWLSDSGDSVTITRNGNAPIEITNFDATDTSEVINTTFASARDGLMTTNKQGLDGSTYLNGDNGLLDSLAVSLSLVENDIDIGAPTVATVNFARSTVAVEGATGGRTLGSALGFNTGASVGASDSFDVVLTRNDGTSSTYTYTYAGAGDTVNDFITAFNAANPDFNLTLSGGGAFRLTEVNRTAGTNLAMVLNNWQDNTGGGSTFVGETMSQTSERFLTSAGQLSGPFTTATNLNSIAEFANIQGGDTLAITLNDEAGADQSFTFNFAGLIDSATTSTIGDLITALNGQTNIAASYDAALGIVVEDNGGNTAGNIALSFAAADLTERFSAADGSNAATSFGTFNPNGSGRGLESDPFSLTLPFSPSTSSQLNSLVGFSNIEGGDVVAVSLTNHLGVSTTVNVTANDVTAGNASSITLGDVINAIDGATIGGSTYPPPYPRGLFQSLKTARFERWDRSPREICITS